MIYPFLVCKSHDPFRCNDTKKCIDRDQTCDGDYNCENGFDEKLPWCNLDNETTTATQKIETGETDIDETTLQPQQISWEVERTSYLEGY